MNRAATPLFLKEVGWQVIRFIAICGQSNPVSFAIRPILRHKRFRREVGMFLVGLVLLGGGWSPVAIGAEDTGGRVEVVVRAEGEPNLKTVETVRVPVTDYKISQKFWWAHPGIDMAAAKGTPVYPVMAGRVIRAEKDWWGYGNHVVISHEEGFESLYAHLSKMNVVEGQEVSTEMVLGRVGSTGRSSGPHLHLEIKEGGKSINPAQMLGLK